MAKEILVVREFDNFSRILRESGHQIVNLPLIETRPLENLDAFDELLVRIDLYDGLFFTSPQAARVFLARPAVKNQPVNCKIYVLGKRTKALFKNSGFELIFRENANTAEDLLKSTDEKEFAGKKFLFVRGDHSLRAIPEMLNGIAEVDEAIVYRTLEISPDEKFTGDIRVKFEHRNIDCVCFFSPSGVSSFIKTFDKKILNDTKIAAIGKTTAKKLLEENLRVDFIAKKAGAESFAAELAKYLQKT